MSKRLKIGYLALLLVVASDSSRISVAFAQNAVSDSFVVFRLDGVFFIPSSANKVKTWNIPVIREARHEPLHKLMFV